MRASILAIGDEIVSGLTLDTNSAWLAERLREVGVEVVGILAVGDDDDAIARALRRGLEDGDVVITTGGLGPTGDDRTAACVARVAERPLRRSAAALETIRERFRVRGREMSPSNEKQADFPEGSTVVPNTTGTAAGFVCPVGSEGQRIISLPGVPGEMRRMAEETVIPLLAQEAGGRKFVSRTFSTFGLPESRLGELLEDVLGDSPGRLSFRAAFPLIQARVTLEGPVGSGVRPRLDDIERRVQERLGHYLYAVGDEGMEETVGRLLTKAGATLAVAESCTGGLIGHRLTDVPGSSAYFHLGITAYHNDAKVRLLGVPEETLATHGAVSTQVAAAMARGVRERGETDIGLSVTGIAGPGGGSAEKPVGTVCIGLASGESLWSRRYVLGDAGRERVKTWSAQIALNRVRLHLLNVPS